MVCNIPWLREVLSPWQRPLRHEASAISSDGMLNIQPGMLKFGRFGCDDASSSILVSLIIPSASCLAVAELNEYAETVWDPLLHIPRFYGPRSAST